jgi:DNA (cytosine-5)-methyltransferase 1
MERTFIDLFSGVGGMRCGFERAGNRCVFSSEIDTYAADTYEANYGERPAGDITKINEDDIPDHDILVGGFPCQAFSSAGDQKGFGDVRGTLFFDIVRILKAKRPKAFLLENVKNLRSHDDGRTFSTIMRTLSGLGYHVHGKVVNASPWVPQRRERIFLVGFSKPTIFRFPEKEGQRKLREILEPDVDPKFTLSDKMWNCLLSHAEKQKAKGNGFHYVLANLDKPTRTLLSRSGGAGDILVPQEGKPRMLTPRECARLQGFPETFKIVHPNKCYKQFGNSVVVPVIEELAKCIDKALDGGFDEPLIWGE